MYAPPVSAHLSPVRRTARLLLLLRQPRTLNELLAELQVSAVQLRRDLADLRAEGWPIEESAERGRTPKHLWLSLPIP
jgi:predicted DNA-binding transcriptional regulator YafY